MVEFVELHHFQGENFFIVFIKGSQFNIPRERVRKSKKTRLAEYKQKVGGLNFQKKVQVFGEIKMTKLDAVFYGTLKYQ